jgi:phycobilisome core component
VAGDSTILNERVLNGLDDTYKSLGVPTGPTVRSIVLLGEVVAEILLKQGVPVEQLGSVLQPFDHLARGLGETNVRQR